MLWSFAPHDLALLLHLVGAAPRVVRCWGSAHLHPERVDQAQMRLLFPSGCVANVHVSWLSPRRARSLSLVGSAGRAVWDALRDDLLYEPGGTPPGPGARPQPQEPTQPLACAEGAPLRLQCRAFLDALTSRQPGPGDALSGVQVIQVLAAAEASRAAGGAATDVGPTGC